MPKTRRKPAAVIPIESARKPSRQTEDEAFIASLCLPPEVAARARELAALEASFEEAVGADFRFTPTDHNVRLAIAVIRCARHLEEEIGEDRGRLDAAWRAMAEAREALAGCSCAAPTLAALRVAETHLGLAFAMLGIVPPEGKRGSKKYTRRSDTIENLLLESGTDPVKLARAIYPDADEKRRRYKNALEKRPAYTGKARRRAERIGI